MHNLTVEEDRVSTIIKAAYEVKRSLSSGLLEANYQRGMEIELSFLDIPYVSQFRCETFHRNISCGLYFVDLLVDDSIVVEVKAYDLIIRKHIAQTYNYMNLTRCKEGLILNFGEAPLGIRRLKSR